MKKILLISAVCVGLLNIPQANADMEAIENSMTQVEKLHKKAQTVLQTTEKVESVYNAARQGKIGGIVKAVKANGFDKIAVKQAKAIAQNIKDKKKLEKAISKDTMANYTNQNQVATHQASKELNDNILRTDLARIYAFAFTVRTEKIQKCIDENKKEEKKDEASESTDSRVSLQMANDEAMESARRWNRILDMQSSMEEFTLRLMARSLSAKAEEEDGDKEGDAK